LIHLAKKVEVFGRGHPVVQPMMFGQNPNRGPDFCRLLDHVMPGNPRSPTGGPENRGQHPDCRRFTRPIRAKQRKHFPGVDFDIYAFDGFKIAKMFGKVFGFDHRDIISLSKFLRYTPEVMITNAV